MADIKEEEEEEKWSKLQNSVMLSEKDVKEEEEEDEDEAVRPDHDHTVSQELVVRTNLSRLQSRLTNALSRRPLDLDYLELICRREMNLLTSFSAHINMLPEVLSALSQLVTLIAVKLEERRSAAVLERPVGERDHVKLLVSKDYLHTLVQTGLTLPCISTLLGVSVQTVRRTTQLWGLSVREPSSATADDGLVSAVHHDAPLTGAEDCNAITTPGNTTHANAPTSWTTTGVKQEEEEEEEWREQSSVKLSETDIKEEEDDDDDDDEGCRRNAVLEELRDHDYSSNVVDQRSVKEEDSGSQNKVTPQRSQDHEAQPQQRVQQAKPHTCDQCGKTFSLKSNLIRHQRIHSASKPFSCDECGKAFTENVTLVMHQLVHSESKPYRCEECGERFNFSDDLSQHVLINHGIKAYRCEQCGQAFVLRSTLMGHMKIHSTEELYHCDHCGKIYKEKNYLKIHLRSHTGHDMSPCDQCDKVFTTYNKLKQHRLSHSSGRPHKCDRCGKSYKWKSKLIIHQRVHEKNVLRCDECGKTFSTSSVLHSHPCVDGDMEQESSSAWEN